jgi:two-component system LytT family response regulator
MSNQLPKGKITAVIVDDEMHGIEFLEYLLNKHFQEIALLKTFTSPLQALEEIPHLDPDIMFVDVEMPQLNGFDLVEKLGYMQMQIIFTTAYNEFALKAFKVSALDYLLKPIDVEDLKTAVQKVKKNVRKDNEALQTLIQFIQDNQQVKKISIASEKGILFIEPEEIVYCKSEGPYTTFHLVNQKQLTSSKNLGDYEELLESVGFYRIHHSTLINIKHLKKYIREDGGYVEMSDGSTHTISRRKKDEFLEFIKK